MLLPGSWVRRRALAIVAAVSMRERSERRLWWVARGVPSLKV